MLSFLVVPHSSLCHLFTYLFCHTDGILQGKKMKHLHLAQFQNDESWMTFKAGPTICLDMLPSQSPLGHLWTYDTGTVLKIMNRIQRTRWIAGNQKQGSANGTCHYCLHECDFAAHCWRASADRPLVMHRETHRHRTHGPWAISFTWTAGVVEGGRELRQVDQLL